MIATYQSSFNRLLKLCGKSDLEALRPHLAQKPLEYRDVLFRSGERIEWLYFPVGGVVSLVTSMTNGQAAEVGTIGNEGLVGLPAVLGEHAMPNSAVVQVPGSCLRLRAAPFQSQLERSAAFRQVMLRYASAFFNQVSLTAACNALHSVERRCCRWLLMTHDRVQADTFLLTHEFLGMMLGVQRSSVSEAARKLRLRRCIAYERGRVTILDRRALEAGACECYKASRAEFDRLLGPSGGPHGV